MVLAGVIFSGQFADVELLTRSLLAFASFCIVSSAMYVFNDWHDREEDHLHPSQAIPADRLRRNFSAERGSWSGPLLSPGAGLMIADCPNTIDVGRYGVQPVDDLLHALVRDIVPPRCRGHRIRALFCAHWQELSRSSFHFSMAVRLHAVTGSHAGIRETTKELFMCCEVEPQLIDRRWRDMPT